MNVKFEFNDTFDNFSLPNTFKPNKVLENVKIAEKTLIDKNEKEDIGIISFDDSDFLNVSLTSLLEEINLEDQVKIDNKEIVLNKNVSNFIINNKGCDKINNKESDSWEKVENNLETRNFNEKSTYNYNIQSDRNTINYNKLNNSKDLFDWSDDNFLNESNGIDKNNLMVTNNCNKENKSNNLDGELSEWNLFEIDEKNKSKKDKIHQLESLNDEEKSESYFGSHLTCNLSDWNIPDMILQKYSKNNVKTMFDWQLKCLNNPKILLNNKNLVYSAPTSAGKTLVAEILAIKTLIERKKKVIFVLPFVSVVREKMFHFQDLLSTSGIRVDGFMGSYHPPGGFKSVQLAICTIEKANSLINRLLEENELDEIGAVIIDEMHLLGDPSRGYLLELLLTKLKYMIKKNNSLNIQIIGMSATLPNLDLLANWLNAELFTTDFRPIPLFEWCHVNGEIYDNNFKLIRKIEPVKELDKDVDNILQLSLETIKSSCSVLIFCPTKNWCESLSQQLSVAFWKLGTNENDLGKILRSELNVDLIKEVFEQLKRCPVGLDKILAKTVAFGVAFHHAGLTMDERDIIEGGFRSGAIRVLVATLTLSSGVNLPAQRVIIRTPNFCGKPLDTLTYRQMIGRAGRMGKDSSGESLLICQKNDYNIAKELTSANLEPVRSCLQSGKLKRAILEVIASGVANTFEDVNLFTSCTLLNDLNLIDEAIEFLKRNEFIRLQTVEENKLKYVATHLGKACLSSSLPPEEGLILFGELEKARRCFVLETELHLIYLVTPYSCCNLSINWMFYLNLWEKLPASMKRVGELVGIRESFIFNASQGKIQSEQKLQIHKRFYTALALQDLVNEVPLNKVALKFNCCRGLLQSLQQSASTFSGMVTAFCKQLGWTSVELLISQFQDRLHFGVNRDILDLMKLPIMNGPRARTLFNSGIENLLILASSTVETIENILHKVMPFESEKEREGESKFDVDKRNKIRSVWITGKRGLTEKEAAEMLVNDARRFIELEMGMVNINWGDKNDCVEESGGFKANLLYKKDLEINENLDQGEKEIKKNILSPTIINTSNEFVAPSQHCLSTIITPINQIKHQKKASTRNKRKLFNYSSESDVQETPEKKRKRKNKNRKKIDPFIIDNLNNINIENIDNKESFTKFQIEIKTKKSISLSLGCTEIESIKKPKIGMKSETQINKVLSFNKEIKGIGFNWGTNTVYYVCFESTSVSKLEKINLLKEIFNNPEIKVRIFDGKEQIKTAALSLGVDFNTNIEDPKVFDWILNPDGSEKNLQEMVIKYIPEAQNLLKSIDDKIKGVGSIGLNTKLSKTPPKLRCCVESVLTWFLFESFLKSQEKKLFHPFYVEMSLIKILSRMELIGFGVNLSKLQELSKILAQQTVDLEKKAFHIAGRTFSFSSSTDVAKILGMYQNKKRISTNKKALEKQLENPIAPLIVQWRKINSILTTTIYPLLKLIKNENRIYPCSITHHATGRISMHEPNLQSVPRNFESNDKAIIINCREAFQAKDNHLLISADYCQLELRLLAHFSKDKNLIEVMKRVNDDVFKIIASKLNNVKVEEVTDEMRQRAKQICYGIIYGMGVKGLSEQMNSCEEEASMFLENFHEKYPGIRQHIQTLIEKCKETGFIETLSGRRRFFENINNPHPAVKSQAERQAVNTTIQGSAADITKNAMVLIENVFQNKFKTSRNKPELVLHIHDELLYEVPEKYLAVTAKIIRKSMENAVKLSIPFPVKIKFGKSWGKLEMI
ncbi:DNA polymerase theta [Onthophagus taurus]|uniref:DNA polymerase theta n=1 Tax=Onthophagus taurus TaxID=166361 RepID=UPI0039BEABC0